MKYPVRPLNCLTVQSAPPFFLGGGVMGFKCYDKLYGNGRLVLVVIHTGTNYMIEGLAVFSTSNDNANSSHPSYPYPMVKFNTPNREFVCVCVI